MAAVPVMLVTSPRIRLWFPDTDPVSGPLMAEFLKISHESQEKGSAESFEDMLERSIKTAIENLGLPFTAELDLSNGAICLTLDVSDVLTARSPSLLVH